MTSENAITVGYFTQPDSLDPALGFTIPANAVLNQVYLPLLTYKRVEGPRGTELIPGLAAALPQARPTERPTAFGSGADSTIRTGPA